MMKESKTMSVEMTEVKGHKTSKQEEGRDLPSSNSVMDVLLAFTLPVGLFSFFYLMNHWYSYIHIHTSTVRMYFCDFVRYCGVRGSGVCTFE